MNAIIKALIVTTIIFSQGCVGYNVPPDVFGKKPFTLLRGSEQIGRDQMANRLLVAKHAFSLKGKLSNEVLTLLGQPQDIQIVEREISEDWLFYYPKGVTDRAGSEQGAFWVRFYHDKVIDTLSAE